MNFKKSNFCFLCIFLLLGIHTNSYAGAIGISFGIETFDFGTVNDGISEITITARIGGQDLEIITVPNEAYKLNPYLAGDFVSVEYFGWSMSGASGLEQDAGEAFGSFRTTLDIVDTDIFPQYNLLNTTSISSILFNQQGTANADGANALAQVNSFTTEFPSLELTSNLIRSDTDFGDFQDGVALGTSGENLEFNELSTLEKILAIAESFPAPLPEECFEEIQQALMFDGQYRAQNGTFVALNLAISSTATTTGAHTLTLAPAVIPIPAAIWMFASAILCLVGISRKRLFNN